MPSLLMKKKKRPHKCGLVSAIINYDDKDEDVRSECLFYDDAGKASL